MAVHITSRADAEAIIREQVVSTIFQDAPKQSVFMSLARKLPNMTSNQTRIRVLDFLPTAYWVNGDTGMKQTSKQACINLADLFCPLFFSPPTSGFQLVHQVLDLVYNQWTVPVLFPQPFLLFHDLLPFL